MKHGSIELTLVIAVLFAGTNATVARADLLPAATASQGWGTPYGGPATPLSQLGPIGSSYWTLANPYGDCSGCSASPPDTGYTDANPSATPSVEADSGVGTYYNSNGTPLTVGSEAFSQIDFYFEVDYIGTGTAVANVPVIGYFDFTGTSYCHGGFNAFNLYNQANGTGFGVGQGDCDGSFSTTWIEPTGGQVPAQLLVGSYSEEVTGGPDYGFASVTLAIDPDTAAWAGLTGDTNAADYSIEYSSNLTSGAPEPGTIGLVLAGASLLLWRYRAHVLRNEQH